MSSERDCTKVDLLVRSDLLEDGSDKRSSPRSRSPSPSARSPSPSPASKWQIPSLPALPPLPLQSQFQSQWPQWLPAPPVPMHHDQRASMPRPKYVQRRDGTWAVINRNSWGGNSRCPLGDIVNNSSTQTRIEPASTRTSVPPVEEEAYIDAAMLIAYSPALRRAIDQLRESIEYGEVSADEVRVNRVLVKTFVERAAAVFRQGQVAGAGTKRRRDASDDGEEHYWVWTRRREVGSYGRYEQVARSRSSADAGPAPRVEVATQNLKLRYVALPPAGLTTASTPYNSTTAPPATTDDLVAMNRTIARFDDDLVAYLVAKILE